MPRRIPGHRAEKHVVEGLRSWCAVTRRRRAPGRSEKRHSTSRHRDLGKLGILLLDWRLFERCLIAVGDLEQIPVQDLGDDVTAPNRRIGAGPVARAARGFHCWTQGQSRYHRAGRAAAVRRIRLCARTQVQRRRG